MAEKDEDLAVEERHVQAVHRDFDAVRRPEALHEVAHFDAVAVRELVLLVDGVRLEVVLTRAPPGGGVLRGGDFGDGGFVAFSALGDRAVRVRFFTIDTAAALALLPARGGRRGARAPVLRQKAEPRRVLRPDRPEGVPLVHPPREEEEEDGVDGEHVERVHEAHVIHQDGHVRPRQPIPRRLVRRDLGDTEAESGRDREAGEDLPRLGHHDLAKNNDRHERPQAEDEDEGADHRRGLGALEEERDEVAERGDAEAVEREEDEDEREVAAPERAARSAEAHRDEERDGGVLEGVDYHPHRLAARLVHAHDEHAFREARFLLRHRAPDLER